MQLDELSPYFKEWLPSKDASSTIYKALPLFNYWIFFYWYFIIDDFCYNRSSLHFCLSSNFISNKSYFVIWIDYYFTGLHSNLMFSIKGSRLDLALGEGNFYSSYAETLVLTLFALNLKPRLNWEFSLRYRGLSERLFELFTVFLSYNCEFLFEFLKETESLFICEFYGVYIGNYYLRILSQKQKAIKVMRIAIIFIKKSMLELSKSFYVII